MNDPSYFEIQVNDLQKARTFYSQVFGWKFIKDPNLPIEYWRIQTEGARGGLLKRPAQVPPPQPGANAYVCSMQVEDFDKTAEVILKNDGLIALEKFAVPGKCWQGYFLDAQENTFGIFQVDKNAK